MNKNNYYMKEKALFQDTKLHREKCGNGGILTEPLARINALLRYLLTFT